MGNNTKLVMEYLYCNTCQSTEPHVLQPGVCYHCLRCRALGKETKKPVAAMVNKGLYSNGTDPQLFV